MKRIRIGKISNGNAQAGRPAPSCRVHDLFSTAYFDENTYQNKLKQVILANADWDNQPEDLKNFLIAKFGNIWKEKTSEIVSWFGLEKPPGYLTFINSHPGYDLIVPVVNNKVRDMGKKECL